MWVVTLKGTFSNLWCFIKCYNWWWIQFKLEWLNRQIRHFVWQRSVAHAPSNKIYQNKIQSSIHNSSQHPGHTVGVKKAQSIIVQVLTLYANPLHDTVPGQNHSLFSNVLPCLVWKTHGGIMDGLWHFGVGCDLLCSFTALRISQTFAHSDPWGRRHSWAELMSWCSIRRVQ